MTADSDRFCSTCVYQIQVIIERNNKKICTACVNTHATMKMNAQSIVLLTSDVS